MRNIKLLSGFALAVLIVNLSACSNTKKVKPAPSPNKDKPVKYRVQTDTNKSKKLSKLSEAWEENGVKNEKQVNTNVIVVKRPQKTQAITKKRVVKTNTTKRNIVKKHTPARHLQYAKRQKNQYKVPSHRAPVHNIRYAQLSGDYAHNNQAKSFINMMASKHGFDRGYLNYLFTKTEATTFLKRMAYADAYGRKKSSKKPRSGRWNRYRGNFLTPRTINKGIEFARANRVALQRAEDQYGVPKEYILGIIGVETRYGGNVGKNRAIDALAAMGFDNPRRGKYFRSELESYLLMTRKERLNPLKPMASYAGALGLSQFMPSNIKRYAVDHDRNGIVNLWTPADAIGSVANYFKKHGWKTGGTVTVRADSINSGYRTLKTGFKSKHSLKRLKSKGVSAKNLGNISGKASLIKLNTYSGDELWLGGHNFYVITRYNHSSHYAMAVHQLAQAIKARIGGRGVIRQASIESAMQHFR